MIRIYIATRSDVLLQSAALGADVLIPEDFRVRNKFASSRSFSVDPLDLNCLTLMESIEGAMPFPFDDSVDGVIVLSDHGEVLNRNIRDAIFFRTFMNDKISQPRNFLVSNLVKCIKEYAIVAARFEDFSKRQRLILPYRNFLAPEVPELSDLIANFPPNPGEEIDRRLSLLGSRRRPKKSASYPDLYFRDDRGLFFRYGPERHATPDTKVPPHDYGCALGASFKFGCRHDDRMHFNASIDKKSGMLSVDLIDCDGADVAIRGKSHANVHSNDFVSE